MSITIDEERLSNLLGTAVNRAMETHVGDIKGEIAANNYNVRLLCEQVAALQTYCASVHSYHTSLTQALANMGVTLPHAELPPPPTPSPLPIGCSAFKSALMSHPPMTTPSQPRALLQHNTPSTSATPAPASFGTPTMPIVTSPPPSGANTPTATQVMHAQHRHAVPLKEALERNKRKNTILMWIPRVYGAMTPATVLAKINSALERTFEGDHANLPCDAILDVKVRTTRRPTPINQLHEVRFKRVSDAEPLIALKVDIERHVDIQLKVDLTPAQEDLRRMYQRIMDTMRDRQFYTTWGMDEHPTFCIAGEFHKVTSLTEATALLSGAPPRSAPTRKRPNPEHPSRFRPAGHSTQASPETDLSNTHAESGSQAQADNGQQADITMGNDGDVSGAAHDAMDEDHCNQPAQTQGSDIPTNHANEHATVE